MTPDSSTSRLRAHVAGPHLRIEPVSPETCEQQRATFPEPPRPILDVRTPPSSSDLHSLVLVCAGLLLVALFGAFYFARAVFFPITMAFLLNFLLSPLVRGMNRLGIPNFVAAIVVLVSGVALVTIGTMQLVQPASQWARRAPQQIQKIEDRLSGLLEPLQTISRTGARVDSVTDVTDGGEEEAVPVKIENPTFATTVLSATGTFATDLIVTLILLFFLLASGDQFLRKTVEVMPKLEDKKKVVELARSIESGISTYLLSVTTINICLGIAIGTAMWLLGMPNPVLWGVMGTALNFVPYLGAIVGTSIVGLVAFATFEEAGYALLVPAVYFLCTSIEGNFVTPTVLGMRLDLNPVVIFIWLLLWGWLWGIPGALLAVPMLAALKILCDHVEPLQPLGKYLVA